MMNNLLGKIPKLFNGNNLSNKRYLFSWKKSNFFLFSGLSKSQNNIITQNSFYFCSNTKEKSTMELIKILRAETSILCILNLDSPLNHIKRALEESKNNIEEAKIWLRKKGFKDAENKMGNFIHKLFILNVNNIKSLGRKAETQLISISINQQEGLIALSNIVCETDFVANTKMFIDFNKYFSKFILAHKQNLSENDFAALEINKYIVDIDNELKGLKLNECIKYLISKTGENCQIKNLFLHKFNPENEFVGKYLHNTVEEDVGKKAAFVILKCEVEKISEKQREKLQELADQVAMQIIASKPRYLTKDEIPAEELKKESELIREGIIAKTKDQTIVSKNEDIDYQNLSEEKLNKLIEKKIASWIDSVCLNEQEFVIVDHDAKSTHEKTGVVVGKRGKSFGITNVKIKEFRAFY
jgi:translation elongation factor EF-Ts